MKQMSSNEIRQMYLKYFEKKGHKIMSSASLIPVDDPTLLWNNAGVTPLKKYFDGSVIPDSKKMTSCQKCIRTNDIESVGDATHHTFFEMLGNFSIGDYFKEEAIKMSYELLTSPELFGFDKEKLYVTIYPNDEEAYNHWIEVGMAPDHIIKLENNFWEIGEGPCGPDSEIFYDRGEKYDEDNLGIRLLKEEIDNSRYVEIWNNVFSQYNAKNGLPRDQYPELPNKNIDTGMGLERMVCIIQGKDSSYDTDLFQPVISEIEKITNKQYNNDKGFRIIADHLRTITFAISDGAVFSNEGRGYVIRRLLRRASRYGRQLGVNEPFLHKLVESVVNTMAGAYPYLREKKEYVEELILKEEELFIKTLSSGEKRLIELMEESTDKIISGEDAFKLYDTYGFPFELTLEYLTDKGYSVSKEEFDECMNNQKDMARSARRSENSMNIQNEKLLNFDEKSTFVGYETTECETKVIALMKDDNFVDQLAGDGIVILEETPFYAESGGQVADTGLISNENLQLEVVDVIKAPHKQHLHIVKLSSGSIKVGDAVTAAVDAERRSNICKNHSATHLLQEALKEALDENVYQAGSRVDEKTLRFDFTYPEKVTDRDIIFAESLVNEKITTKFDAVVETMTLEEAKKKGAVALFEEKYDDQVRVVSLYDSIELCGGTHVKNVSDINKFAIKSIESKGANVYRIEAATDENIEEELYEVISPYNKEMINLLQKAKGIIEEAESEGIKLTFNVYIDNSAPTSYNDIVYNRKEVENVRNKLKDLEKEYMKLKEEKSLENTTYLDELVKHNSIGDYLITKVEGYDLKILKQLIDKYSNKLNNAFVFIANVNGSNVNYVAKCSEATGDKIDCGNLVREASLKSNGNGGGSKVFAQGGGTTIEQLDEVLATIEHQVSNL